MLERCLAEQGDLHAAARCVEAVSLLRDTERPAVDRLHAATSAPMRDLVRPATRSGRW